MGVDYSQVDLRLTGDLYRVYSAYGNWSPHSPELDKRKRMDGWKQNNKILEFHSTYVSTPVS